MVANLRYMSAVLASIGFSSAMTQGTASMVHCSGANLYSIGSSFLKEKTEWPHNNLKQSHTTAKHV